ncbi:MAG: hypothetical protein KBD28_04355 [Chitinophagaceae bacterium]|nr:hypothetical protein [Chitinophagaceae bacterium]
MTEKIINDLIHLLQQISDADYSKKIERLNNSTIGQHVRHSIEMYQCIINNSNEEEVNYSNRKRDIVIETSSNYAIQYLQTIVQQIQNNDRIVYVKNNDDDVAALSSYNREVAYCNEHLIHHLALIKVALQETNQYNISSTFGIAPSTIKYREQCAQ